MHHVFVGSKPTQKVGISLTWLTTVLSRPCISSYKSSSPQTRKHPIRHHCHLICQRRQQCVPWSGSVGKMEMEHGGDNYSHQEGLEAIYWRLVQTSMPATGGRRGYHGSANCRVSCSTGSKLLQCWCRHTLAEVLMLATQLVERLDRRAWLPTERLGWKESHLWSLIASDSIPIFAGPHPMARYEYAQTPKFHHPTN